MEASMTRDRKLLVAMKRHETDDTFWHDDAELQEADTDTLRELAFDEFEAEDERTH
jgi:hypothetical protein